MRKGKAAKLLQANTGRMHVPTMARQSRRGRENFPRAVKERKLLERDRIVLSMRKDEGR